ncbi:MAG: sulfatase-like hydrolase/transferase [Phycisphaerales bacterium]|nr:sulfatase-like hydrolase/transferase [Phycisphaerales bacterium]
MQQTTAPSDVPNASADRFSLAAAGCLLIFLAILKIYLLIWYWRMRDINPLADLPADGVLYLCGADLILCFLLAIFYRALQTASHWTPSPLRWFVSRAIPYAVHVAMAVFAVVSLQVNEMYGSPLEIRLMRSADDPAIVRASVMAYAGIAPLILIALGLAIWPILLRPLNALLGRWRWATRPRRLWLVAGTVAVVGFGLWTVRLSGHDTYGVKQNAIVFFIKHYEPPISPIDIQQRLKKLQEQFSNYGENQQPTDSIQRPDQPLERDFARPADGRDMNILVIQMESTMSVHMDRKTTPNIMALADHGLRFTHHATVFAQTERASYCLYYSDYLLNIGSNISMIYGRPLPQPCLAELLKQNGYQTALFHSGFLSYANLNYLFRSKGFDTLVDARDLWNNQPLPWSWGVREEQTVDAIDQWLQSHGQQKFFLLYSTIFPHHPYLCPSDDKPYPDDTWLNRYRNSLHYADANVGRLVESLRRQNLLDKTIIVVVGDHGQTVSTYPVGHGISLTSEEIWTPFIISNPKLFPNAVQSKLFTSHIDVSPTLASLVGLKSPPQWLGRDLLADSIPARVSFLTLQQVQIDAILDNGIMYEWDERNGHSQLYHLDGNNMTKLDPSDPLRKLMDQYHQRESLFQNWVAWRHYSRAVGGANHP